MRIRYVVIGVALGTAAGVAAGKVRGWWKTWGVEADEATKPLAGDEVVPIALGRETRGITIAAPPEAVWPWLVQLGYGRAGWYSYDQLDQRGRSADEIHDEWQTLAVGDIVPTHPGGGFEVVALEPGRALVLKSDTALVTAQAEAAKAAEAGLETATVGVQMSGAMLSGMPRQYAASWAFVLEPLDGGRTRLIERFRIWFDDTTSGPAFVMPLVGFGLFVMMQKQMVGIRERAQRLAATRGAVSMAPRQNGHQAPAKPGEAVGARV
jgi:hypothetical protein